MFTAPLPNYSATEQSNNTAWGPDDSREIPFSMPGILLFQTALDTLPFEDSLLQLICSDGSAYACKCFGEF